MSNQKKYGLNYERKRKQELIDQGYNAFRCRGSFGLFDIIAAKKKQWLLESIKSTKQNYYSFKQEREELELMIIPPYSSIELWIWLDKLKERKAHWEKEIIKERIG